MKLKVGRHTINISNEDKVLFGKSGITKAELINYYIAIAPIMMHYLDNRPISMQRFPHGIDQEGFFQKNANDYFPDFVTRIAIPKKSDGTANYVVIDKPATLIYLANQDCITTHTWLSTIDNLELPDRMIFDLDPADNCTFKDVQNVAKKLKTKLDTLTIPTFCMLTGSRGVHIVVPLKRVHTFDETRAFAHTIATQLAEEFPTLITTTMHKADRKDRVFVDWLRNGFGSTGVTPYAVRAHEGAPVAMPVTWEELLSPTMHSQYYTINNAMHRINTIGDIWHSMHKHAISLKKKINFTPLS